MNGYCANDKITMKDTDENTSQSGSSSDDDVIVIKRRRKRRRTSGRLTHSSSMFDAYKKARKEKENASKEASNNTSQPTNLSSASKDDSLAMLTGNELREINESTPSTSTSREFYPERHSSTLHCHKDTSNTFKGNKTKKARNALKPKRLFGTCKHSSASDTISNLTPSSNEQQTSIKCVVKRKGPLREWSGGMVF